LSANGKGKGEGDEHCEGKEHLERRETEGRMGLVLPRDEIILWESSSARIDRRAWDIGIETPIYELNF
jgi:hypothetical protein